MTAFGIHRRISKYSILFIYVLKQIPRLTVKSLAYGIHSLEAYALHLACFEVREIDVCHSHFFRKLIQRHLTVSHYPVKSDYYSHSAPPYAIESLSSWRLRPYTNISDIIPMMTPKVIISIFCISNVAETRDSFSETDEVI